MPSSLLAELGLRWAVVLQMLTRLLKSGLAVTVTVMVAVTGRHSTELVQRVGK